MTIPRSSPETSGSLQGKKLAEAHSLLQECGYNFYEVHPECYRNFSYVKFFNLLEARAGVAQASGIDPATWERVFQDACDEAGCQYDNEALLQAIASLKLRASGCGDPSCKDPDCTYGKGKPRCQNCGDPIAHGIYCGTCREMGCSVPSTHHRQPSCECGFAVDVCRTNHCHRKQIASAGLSPVPAGYSKLPDGVVCKCFKMWRATDGSHWCCLPSPGSSKQGNTP